MSVRPEVIPFVVSSLIVGGLMILGRGLLGASWARAAVEGATIGVVFALYMLWFFRDPERTPPPDESLIVAGADGVVALITDVHEKKFLKTDCVRISIFLNLFNVHVNRAPISGVVRFAQYYPGKRYFTFQDKSSEFNQHSSILLEGPQTRCLIHQIVGPVCRRVVYWLTLNQAIARGERFGMMKFGSRMDLYFPKSDVIVIAKKGDKVRAGETVIAKLRKDNRL